jgi:metal-responsive CopG/Arc/MetJ family transcriptional regulator
MRTRCNAVTMLFAIAAYVHGVYVSSSQCFHVCVLNGDTSKLAHLASIKLPRQLQPQQHGSQLTHLLGIH